MCVCVCVCVSGVGGAMEDGDDLGLSTVCVFGEGVGLKAVS